MAAGHEAKDVELGVRHFVAAGASVQPRGIIPPECTDGDCNGDGMLTTADVTCVILRLFELCPSPPSTTSSSTSTSSATSTSSTSTSTVTSSGTIIRTATGPLGNRASSLELCDDWTTAIAFGDAHSTGLTNAIDAGSTGVFTTDGDTMMPIHCFEQ